MKNILICSAIILSLFSCATKKETKRIPLTTTSKEAAEYFNQGVFRQEQLENDEGNALFKKALELDSNFALAKINYNNQLNPADNKRRLIEAYNNRAKLSEMESVIVAVKYENTINNDHILRDAIRQLQV